MFAWVYVFARAQASELHVLPCMHPCMCVRVYLCMYVCNRFVTAQRYAESTGRPAKDGHSGTRVTCFVVEVSGDRLTGTLSVFYCITSSLVKFVVPGQTLRQLSCHYGTGGFIIFQTQVKTA